METKKQIRKEILALRDAVAKAQHRAMSGNICQNIQSLPEFEAAEKILAFAGYGSEPDTYPLMQQCLDAGKQVFCPLVTGENMEFYQIKDLSELLDGYKGIKEPKPLPERKYKAGEGDLMLLPGAVFDREGNRIGYGKGFYDRYLAGGFPGKKAALAFSFQIVENGRIPSEETDQSVNCIVTEKEILRIWESRG